MALGTLVVYLLIGLVAGALLAVRAPSRSLPAPAAFAVRALLWPVFLPQLAPGPAPAAGGDEARIQAAEAQLAAALRELGGLLGDGLGLELRRVEALGRALRGAAARRAELTALLTRPEHDPRLLGAELERARADPGVAEILGQRLEHVRRLEALREQTERELAQALARAGELATRLTLLRYDAAAAPGAAATAAQLTRSIDDLSAVLGEVRAASA